jgi:SAM-dependent methyltransferase
MRNESLWRPSKFVYKNGKLKGSRDKQELALTSRLGADIVAKHYDNHIKLHVQGKLIDLGCGKVPLYQAYKNHVSEITCADWATENSKNQFLDTTCDLNLPLPFESNTFNTVILSDVLEHIYKPDMLWKEMSRILAPGGKIILNTPFFYKLHETPHDYYRHTRFALTKHAFENNLKITSLIEMGGLPEILGDLTSKACAYIPVIGTGLSLMAQWLCGIFIKTSFGRGISKKTSGQFPLGYFMVVEKPHENNSL